jgi:ribonucleotide reductase alpha subunit
MNSATKSSGAIHWMQFIDSLGNYVGQSGRRPAMLISLSCTHPDLIDFIKVKSDHTKIQNANISVHCTDAFYKAVEKDQDWELFFEIPEVKKGGRVCIDADSRNRDAEYDKDTKKWYYIAKKHRKAEKIKKIVKAREVLELIAQQMCVHGEPGIQNIDVARKFSNSDYVYDPKDEYDSNIISTNACCVAEDTYVITNKGKKTIKDIHDAIEGGEKDLCALSFNLDKKVYEFKSILNSWQKRNDKTVTLTIEENGQTYSAECSADHKILTKNRGYIEAVSLTSDDDITIFNQELF